MGPGVASRQMFVHNRPAGKLPDDCAKAKYAVGTTPNTKSTSVIFNALIESPNGDLLSFISLTHPLQASVHHM